MSTPAVFIERTPHLSDTRLSDTLDNERFASPQWPGQSLSNRAILAVIPAITSESVTRHENTIDARELYDQHLRETWEDAFTVEDQQELQKMLTLEPYPTRRSIRAAERLREREEKLQRRARILGLFGLRRVTSL